ncbi:MAG: UvrD-helicase domain-containing protein [Pleurocapsa sp. SU_196_0]|nr:UvrD-helicase domain-containing protein [Pleurocapsa sp. SU_196_0]
MIQTEARPRAVSAIQPSSYQRAIFEAFQRLPPGGTLQINAVAGSGKTTTLIKLLELLEGRDRANTLMCAFNTTIRDALKARAPKGVRVMTIHGLGMQVLGQHFSRRRNAEERSELEQDRQKYAKLLRDQLAPNWTLEAVERAAVCDAVLELTDLCRLTVTNPLDRRALRDVAITYGMNLPTHLEALVLESVALLLHLGRTMAQDALESGGATSIDFVDMLWLPLVFDLSPRHPFDVVFVNEAQDLSKAQLELVLRVPSPRARRVFVGDRRQAIYGFAGADHRSFDAIADRTRALRLPLSVSYRCPKRVITLAQVIVPELEAAPDAPQGVVREVSEAEFLESVSPDDLVLCRVNAPLIDAALHLLRTGRSATVRGNEIPRKLVAISKQVLQSTPWSRFVEGVERWREAQIDATRELANAEELAIRFTDLAECLTLFTTRFRASGTAYTPDAFEKFIADVFTERPGETIRASRASTAPRASSSNGVLAEAREVAASDGDERTGARAGREPALRCLHASDDETLHRS